MNSKGYFDTYRGEAINTLLMELLIACAIWKTWFSVLVTPVYLVSAVILLLLLRRAKRLDTPEAYEGVGKVAFGILILDTFVFLLRLR